MSRATRLLVWVVPPVEPPVLPLDDELLPEEEEEPLFELLLVWPPFRSTGCEVETPAPPPPPQALRISESAVVVTSLFTNADVFMVARPLPKLFRNTISRQEEN